MVGFLASGWVCARIFTAANKPVFAEIRLAELNPPQSIYLAEPEDAYQLADIINNFSAAEETSFLSE